MKNQGDLTTKCNTSSNLDLFAIMDSTGAKLGV